MQKTKQMVNVFGVESGIMLPTFPLNTDGIDLTGKNMTFRRIKITNFDDTIVPKPAH